MRSDQCPLKVIAFALSFTICYATRFGLGKHERDVLDELRTQLEKLEYTFTALYNPALMATKTSILIFYLSLAKGQKVFRWTSVGTLVVVNVAGLALVSLKLLGRGSASHSKTSITRVY